MFQLSLICLLTVHLLAVNVASGAPFVCIWLSLRARRGDFAADLVGRRLARWSLDALSFGVLLGVALGAILWWLDQGAFVQALGRIEPRRLAFGGIELLFYFVLMAWYLARWGRPTRWFWLHPLVALMAGTNLIYHFPILFTVVAMIAERAGAADTSQPFVAWLRDPELLARVAHFCLASLAVTGAAMMMVVARSSELRTDETAANRAATWGAHCILWPSLVQLPLGLYVLLQIPERARDALLGDDLIGAAIFAIALLAVLMLLQQLATALLGHVRAVDAPKYVALLGLIVLLMVGARERSRQPLLKQPLLNRAAPAPAVESATAPPTPSTPPPQTPST